jgi:hypothetical protein
MVLDIKQLRAQVAARKGKRAAMRAQAKKKEELPEVRPEPAGVKGKGKVTDQDLKMAELEAQIARAKQRIAELELENKRAKTRLESAQRRRAIEERETAGAKTKLAQVEQTLAQAKTDQAKAESRAARAERRLLEAMQGNPQPDEKEEYEEQDAADFVCRKYSKDATVFILRQGIGEIVDYVGDKPLDDEIESILNSTREEELGGKSVKIKTTEEIKDVLKHMGVNAGINPFDANTVFSLLPRILIDSVGKEGGFGTDMMARKAPTIVVQINGVEYVLQKGKSQDALILHHRGEHIAILQDYPSSTRHMARNFLSMR